MPQNKIIARLGILAIFTIAGMIFMFRTSQQIDAQVTLVELERARSALITDFNPCAEVECGPGQTATFVGEDTSARTELHPYGGNKVCQCTDGRTFITRAYVPKRFA